MSCMDRCVVGFFFFKCCRSDLFVLIDEVCNHIDQTKKKINFDFDGYGATTSMVVLCDCIGYIKVKMTWFKIFSCSTILTSWTSIYVPNKLT